MNKSKILNIIGAVAGFFGLMIYLSMHTMLGFIGYFTFVGMQYILGILIAVSACLSLANLLKLNDNRINIATLSFNLVATVFSLAYFFALASHAKVYLLECAKILAVYVFIAIAVYLIFYHGKTEYKGKRAVAIILAVVLIGGSVLCFTDFNTLRINYITEGAAVYAVGDEYQIVWTTRAKGIGWVEVGDEAYYDEYAGAKRSAERVHKVLVPMSVLDAAGGYTIKSRAMLSEQGFSGVLGYTVKSSYNFRAVDATDGIQAYTVSDIHDGFSAAKKAAEFYGDQLDFMVVAGDVIDYINSSASLGRILSFCHDVTGGERPVVFARGNHELKCEDAEKLHRYVGADGEKFYYTFRLGPVWGVVLDMGEDHADDWYEFYDTAVYDAYRAEQTAFLDGIIADKSNEYEAAGVEYRIGVCHTPTALTFFKEPFMYDELVNINDRLNQIGLNVMLSGHFHECFKVEGTYEAGRALAYDTNYKASDGTSKYIATGANYVNIVASRRSETQTSATKAVGNKFIGAALELSTYGKTVRFTNAKREILFTVNPFEAQEYGKIIVL